MASVLVLEDEHARDVAKRPEQLVQVVLAGIVRQIANTERVLIY